MYHSIDLRSDSSERVPHILPDYPVYAGLGALSLHRDMRSPSHWHDDLEFGLIVSGRMAYAINGEPCELEAGEGIFINSRQLHHNYARDGGDCTYICVLIHPSLLCPNAYFAENCVAPITSNAAFPYCVLKPDIPWHLEVMRCVQQIQRAFGEFGPQAALLQQSVSYRVAALLLQHMPARGQGTAVDARLGTLRRMVGFVQHHYQERITLREIALAGGVGESTCRALFRKHLRQTPMGYLSRYRLEKGMELLKQPGLSVTEVALSIGFSSPSYFAECFHRHLGLTPTEYRAGL